MLKIEIITKKKGFTLIELLVVISIIAVLLSILMPALSKAKYMTKRLICMTRVKDQATSQFTYAADWDGKFSPNNSRGPQYMGSTMFEGNNTYEAMIDKYITNTDVMFCPLLVKLGDYFDERYRTGFYAGWDIMEWSGLSKSHGQAWDPLTMTRPTEIENGYCWFAAFREDVTSIGPATYLDGEPPWPKNMEECSSRAAFISHELSTQGIGPSDTVYWDLTHGGGWETFGLPLDELTSEDSPVGYADGSVIFHKKNEMRPRALCPFFGDYYYWY